MPSKRKRQKRLSGAKANRSSGTRKTTNAKSGVPSQQLRKQILENVAQASGTSKDGQGAALKMETPPQPSTSNVASGRNQTEGFPGNCYMAPLRPDGGARSQTCSKYLQYSTAPAEQVTLPAAAMEFLKNPSGRETGFRPFSLASVDVSLEEQQEIVKQQNLEDIELQWKELQAKIAATEIIWRLEESSGSREAICPTFPKENFVSRWVASGDSWGIETTAGLPEWSTNTHPPSKVRGAPANKVVDMPSGSQEVDNCCALCPDEDTLRGTEESSVSTEEREGVERSGSTLSIVYNPEYYQRVPNNVARVGINPVLAVEPARSMNFANNFITFHGHVANVAGSVELDSKMFEVVAETPSGFRLRGCIKADKDPETGGFSGFFKATHEVGVYALNVRLALPSEQPWETAENVNDRVVGSSISIFVSRNYLRESQFTPEIWIPLQMDSPEGTKVWGLACDQEKNWVYYSERLAHRISCLDMATGKIIFRFNTTSSQGARLNRPCGLSFDQYNRRVLVCDKDNHRICYFSPDGGFISSFGSSGHANGQFNYPWDVDVSSRGDLIVVSDSRNKRIQLFDRFGQFMSKYSIFETNPLDYKDKFDYPRGICFDGYENQIYVTDFNTRNILSVPLTLGSSERLCQEDWLNRPQGIVTDSLGNILVCDSKNNCVRHMNRNGDQLSSIHSVGDQRLNHPINMTLLRDGSMALLDVQGKLYII